MKISLTISVNDSTCDSCKLDSAVLILFPNNFKSVIAVARRWLIRLYAFQSMHLQRAEVVWNCRPFSSSCFVSIDVQSKCFCRVEIWAQSLIVTPHEKLIYKSMRQTVGHQYTIWSYENADTFHLFERDRYMFLYWLFEGRCYTKSWLQKRAFADHRILVDCKTPVTERARVCHQHSLSVHL